MKLTFAAIILCSLALLLTCAYKHDNPLDADYRGDYQLIISWDSLPDTLLPLTGPSHLRLCAQQRSRGKWKNQVSGTKSTFKKLTLDLFAIYESNEEDLGIDPKKYGTADINNDQTFKFPGVPLYCHRKYKCSEDKEFVKPVRYRAVITNGRQDKALEVLLDLPVSDAKKPVDLKEGMYDDQARNAKPGKHPA
jgi:hypothetical protein